MGTKEKLIERFKSQPNDFNWDELVRLFSILGYDLKNKGRTSGSRVIFVKGESSYIAHKPHPGSIVKRYVMKQVFEFLTKNELI
ncbi:MAG: type II toxin-antitoxin system HicA family toxin [Odoribacter sp.]|nr:type II toxin-antitoxin system HicA family toxin [Odoribacter sp.]